MNVGLILGLEHPAGDDPARRFAEHREQVRLARAAGFDLVGIPQPTWMGANASAAAVRRAARLADAWIVSAHPDLDTVERHLDTYREALAALGKPFPAELPVLRNIYVAADMETALAEARPYFEASYEVFGDWGLFANVLRAGTRQLRGAELRRGRLIIGGPEDRLEQIAACRERVPIGCLLLRMQWLGMPHAQVARAIDLVGAKLLPALRRL